MTATAFQSFPPYYRVIDGSKLNSLFTGQMSFSAALTALSVSGATTPTGGVGPAGGFLAPTVFHSGGLQPATATIGTDTTPSVTETYIAEVFIPCNTTLTGVSLLNGSAAAGNITVALADSSGNVLASSASTAQSGTAAYQQVAFSATYATKGPAKYFLLLQCNNTGARFRTHVVGNFGAGKLTGQTYGTLPAFTPPTTFTTNLGPIADVY